MMFKWKYVVFVCVTSCFIALDFMTSWWRSNCNQCGRYLYLVDLSSYPNSCYGALHAKDQAVRRIARMSCPYAHCDFSRLCMCVGFLGRATYDGKAIGPNGYKCFSNSYYTRSLDNANRLYENRTDGDSGKIVSSFLKWDEGLLGFMALSIRMKQKLNALFLNRFRNGLLWFAMLGKRCYWNRYYGDALLFCSVIKSISPNAI
jgi:hypothetical protein